MLRHPRPATRSTAFRAGMLLGAIWLAACTPHATREARTQPPATGAEAIVQREGAPWILDSSASELRVLVYRSGALARLGHNHVLRARQLEARAWEGPDGSLTGAGVDLRIPVAQFVVDDPGDRSEAGPEFAAPVSDAARSGTLANLLRAEVLDAAAFPDLRVRATVVSVAGTSAVSRARVTIRAVTREIELPLTLETDGGGLVASATVALRQSDFDMVPFSIGGGAIAVADEVQVQFKLRFTLD